MKKFFIYAIGLMAFTACSTNSSEKSDDSTLNHDSVVAGEKVAVDSNSVIDMQESSANSEDESEAFYNSLPNIKKLTSMNDEKKEAKYLHSLGYKGSFKVQGMEEDWRANGTFTLENGTRKCVVKAHIDGYYENYEIIITGDDAAKEKFYNEVKKVKRTKYDSPVKIKMKGNTIYIDIQNY